MADPATEYWQLSRGPEASHAGVYRDRLLNGGVIEASGRGYVTFAVPYTDSYLGLHPARENSATVSAQLDREKLRPSLEPQSPGDSRYMEQTSRRERLFGADRSSCRFQRQHVSTAAKLAARRRPRT